MAENGAGTEDLKFGPEYGGTYSGLASWLCRPQNLEHDPCSLERLKIGARSPNLLGPPRLRELQMQDPQSLADSVLFLRNKYAHSDLITEKHILKQSIVYAIGATGRTPISIILDVVQRQPRHHSTAQISLEVIDLFQLNS